MLHCVSARNREIKGGCSFTMPDSLNPPSLFKDVLVELFLFVIGVYLGVLKGFSVNIGYYLRSVVQRCPQI